MRQFSQNIQKSVHRCKKWIISVFITYCLSSLIGIMMVNSGNHLALSTRDKIIGHAMHKDRALIHYIHGNHYSAILLDFSENLFIGSLTQTVVGLSIVIPYITVSLQGWIGGIVSVDYNHLSRLKNFKSAMYYIIVLILQFIPYSLTVGSGIKLGIETYRLNIRNNILQYRIDTTSLKDVLRIYLIAIPLFFFASCFEFLSAWNM